MLSLNALAMLGSLLASSSICFTLLEAYVASRPLTVIQSTANCSIIKAFRSPSLAADLVFLADLAFFNSSICTLILYTSGICVSFPSEMWNREHLHYLVYMQAFNLYYFRNWIPSLTLVQLSGKPRSLGLVMGGVLLPEESVPALRTS